MDIIVLLLVGGGIVLGIIRGFVTEVLLLMAWVAAVMALRLFYSPVSDWATIKTGTEAGGAVLAFAGLFLGAFILFKVIASQLGSRTRQSVVGPVDRLLGGGFGAVKGLICASLLFLAVNLACDVVWGKDEPRPDWIAAGRTYPLIKLSSRLIVDFVEERRTGDTEQADRADGSSDKRGRKAGRTSEKQTDSDNRKGSKSPDDNNEENKGYSSKDRRELNDLLDAANALGI